jgi:hypothetical protein
MGPSLKRHIVPTLPIRQRSKASSSDHRASRATVHVSAPYRSVCSRMTAIGQSQRTHRPLPCAMQLTDTLPRDSQHGSLWYYCLLLCNRHTGRLPQLAGDACLAVVLEESIQVGISCSPATSNTSLASTRSFGCFRLIKNLLHSIHYLD